ncbi:GH24759 [Drosophila grimshawi]|uniref:GH24759 n=1 Tax=Drosophila grimshawi TaxID=7222 RepID=B4JN66_DROGR|nr:GH24759 [Drosophila grimshawi]
MLVPRRGSSTAVCTAVAGGSAPKASESIEMTPQHQHQHLHMPHHHHHHFQQRRTSNMDVIAEERNV